MSDHTISLCWNWRYSIIGRSTPVFYVQQSTLYLETRDRSKLPTPANCRLGIWHCATLPLSTQLGVPKIPVPASVLSALSHVDLSVAQNLFVAIAVAVKATQVTQQHGYTINGGARWRPASPAKTRRQPPWQLASDFQCFRPGHNPAYTHYPDLSSI